MSFEELKNYSFSMLDRYKTNGMDLYNLRYKEIRINGLRAYETTFNSEFEEVIGETYQVVVRNEKVTLLFCGTSYSDQEMIMQQITKIAYTIQLL